MSLFKYLLALKSTVISTIFNVYDTHRQFSIAIVSGRKRSVARSWVKQTGSTTNLFLNVYKNTQGWSWYAILLDSTDIALYDIL